MEVFPALGGIAACWTLGFLIIREAGTWLPLTALAVGLATLFLSRSPALRSLLRPSVPTVGLGLLAAFGMIAVTYLLERPLAARWPALAGATTALYGLLGAKNLPRGVLVVSLLATTFSEEVVFRGRVLSTRSGMTPGWTWIASSAFYALSHLASGSPWLVGIAFVCGLYWGALRLATRSLVPSVLAHALWDLAILVVWPLA